MEDPLRLIVLAADPMIRAVLAAQLGTWRGVEVVGQTGAEAGDGAELQAEFGPADAIVWDWGWEQAAEPVELPGEPLPLVALVNDAEDAAEAWAAGVRGILSREISLERIISAARASVAGLVVIAPEYASALSAPSTTADGPREDLTLRERDVLRLLAEGLTNKAIAQQLDISDHTVKFHVTAIMSKLGAQSRTEAVVRATRLGLLSL
jgi:DNA-binding NarL/FixJ family response regulator